MKHAVIPIFIPHKGCPFDCIYCNQKTISGEADEMTDLRMREIIEQNLLSLGEETYIEIGFFGGSFTGIDKEEQINFLRTANEYIKIGRVKSIRLSTRPDYIDEQILDYLKEYSVRTIELGAQSLDMEVLKISCRGHDIDAVENASRLIKKYGFELGIQTMIGLPGDSKEKDIQTARKVAEIKPSIVRIYPALVIRDTYMEKMYKRGNYLPLSLEAAVDICSELMDIYEENGINVIRVGLQPTDTINDNMDVVAGPFHPAFRQLAESKRMLNKLSGYILEKGLNGEKSIVIYCSKNNVSNVVGQKRENIKVLKQRFNINNIKVSVDEKLEGRSFYIEPFKNY